MAPINATEVRDALAWATDKPDQPKAPSDNPWIWFWEAMQGDFNENRSTKQIVMDAAISMIPGIDQICDVRDLIADCKKLYHDISDGWAWVALALTLIGLFPTLGSLVKGVLKLFFLFVRKNGADAIAKAVDLAMTWVITFLRRHDIQKYLRLHHIDEVFAWLAKNIKVVREKVNVKALVEAFDAGIFVLESLVKKVSLIPAVGKKAQAALEEVKRVRLVADKHLADAVKPVKDALDAIILRLERELMEKQRAIVNVNNIHFRGALPEATAVTLMRQADPLPGWLSRGTPTKWSAAKPQRYRGIVDELSDKAGKLDPSQRYPYLEDRNILSFHRLAAAEIKGPAKLFRVIAPNSRAMGECWVSEEIFNKIQNSPDPRAAWRKYLAVWPDWNVNGQYVQYDIKQGETLKVWRGEAALQAKANLPDRYLEGGWEQVVFKIDWSDTRNDGMLYYKIINGKGTKLENPITQGEVDALLAKMTKDEQKNFWDTHTSIREKINHPNISGPFDTGWGYTDFGGDGFLDKVGLPSLPGQTTTLRQNEL